MNKWLQAGLVVSLLASSLTFAEETTHEKEQFTREEVDHAYGTEPGSSFLPQTPYNTEASPQFAISETDAADTPLPVYKLTDNTYFFYGNIAEVDENNRGFNGNAGFVVTSDGVVVIDALGSPKLGKRIISTIKSVTDKPIKALIITHNHPDHAYGAVAFKELDGVAIIGHDGTMKYIESGRVESSVSYRNTFIKNDMKGFKAIKPDIMIGGEPYTKKTIHIGDRTFDIYNTGAHHSFGDLVVHQVEDNFVWISDLAFNNRLTFMADGNSKKAIEAQTWLLDTFKNARLMIPGHGSTQTAPFPMVSKTRSYMMKLREQMAKAVEDDIELQTAVDHSEFPEWQNANMYGLNHKKNVDFVYREMEEALF
jgi:glyoxylase-like metal-dependent hydrolase (beta-lactamase superfamily II)